MHSYCSRNRLSSIYSLWRSGSLSHLSYLPVTEVKTNLLKLITAEQSWILFHTYPLIQKILSIVAGHSSEWQKKNPENLAHLQLRIIWCSKTAIVITTDAYKQDTWPLLRQISLAKTPAGWKVSRLLLLSRMCDLTGSHQLGLMLQWGRAAPEPPIDYLSICTKCSGWSWRILFIHILEQNIVYRWSARGTFVQPTFSCWLSFLVPCQLEAYGSQQR